MTNRQVLHTFIDQAFDWFDKQKEHPAHRHFRQAKKETLIGLRILLDEAIDQCVKEGQAEKKVAKIQVEE